MSERNVFLRSTQGPLLQEVEFQLKEEGKRCTVTSEVRIEGRAPMVGPVILTPVSPETAQRWLNSQIARLAKHPGQLKPIPTREQIVEAVGNKATVLGDPVGLIKDLMDRALRGEFD